MPEIAFFRLEHTLARRSAAGCAAFLALRQASPWSRLSRLAAVGASLPLAAAVGPLDAFRPTRMLWRPLKGCSEDRLAVLCEDWWAEELNKSWNEAGLKLLDRCRAAGMKIVLLSDQPRQAVGPAVDHLGADALLCNQLEVVHGEVTGALVEPVFTGRFDGGLLRAHAERMGCDPGSVVAYGSSGEDATLLSGARRPCAVTPDGALRRLARELDWPVVEVG